MLKARFGSDLDRIVHSLFPFVAGIRVRPDTLTLVGVGFAALAALAFGLDRTLAGGILMLAAGFYDLIDGVVARSQGNSSPAGALFDASMDRVSDLLIFAGIAAPLAGRADVGGILLVCWALGASVMTSYVRARAEARLESLGVGIMERGERWIVLILGALTGFLMVALWVVAIGGTVTSIQRLVVARRELRKLEAPPEEAQGSPVEPSPAEPAPPREHESLGRVS